MKEICYLLLQEQLLVNVQLFQKKLYLQILIKH